MQLNYFSVFILCLGLLATTACNKKANPATSKTNTAKTNDLEAQVNARMADFIAALNDADWETVMDMTYPKLFTIAPRDAVIMAMNQMEKEGISMTTASFDLIKLEGPQVVDGEQFLLVHYNSDMTVALSGDQYDDPGIMDLMEASFKSSFDGNKVTVDKEKKTIRIEGEKTMYAIAPEESTEWSFLENKAEQAELLNMLVPEEVRKAFEKK